MAEKLIQRNTQDPVAQENFNRLENFINNEAILRTGFEFASIRIGSAVTNFRYRHNLGFLVKDVIVTSVIGPGAVTFNYDKFDSQFLDITTTGACVIRAFLGSYAE